MAHTYATRMDVTLSPASDDSNYGHLWYAMVNHRCIAMLLNDELGDADKVNAIIDKALAELNAQTEAYLATI